MEQRFIDYKENADNFVYGYSFVDYKLNPIFILFDELGAFRASADKKVFAETMANLTEVILKGREMGVFCVLNTQQPNANNIPTELRDNLSVRIAHYRRQSLQKLTRRVHSLRCGSMCGSGMRKMDMRLITLGLTVRS